MLTAACVQPIALVTWGRTLEVSAVASPDVCDWLQSTTATRNGHSDVKHIREYNLLLTKPAKQQTHRTKVCVYVYAVLDAPR